jgi:membrane glycosyltransferase
VELPVAAELNGAAVSLAVVERYLDALRLEGTARSALVDKMFERAGPAHDNRSLFAALHAALADHDVDRDNPSRGSVAARTTLAATPYPPPPPAEGEGEGWLATSPPLARTPMAPAHWVRGWLDRFRRRARDPGVSDGAPDTPGRHGHWRRVGSQRRIALVVLIVGQAYFATNLM